MTIKQNLPTVTANCDCLPIFLPPRTLSAGTSAAEQTAQNAAHKLSSDVASDGSCRTFGKGTHRTIASASGNAGFFFGSFFRGFLFG
jgi:hypothetical protein